jgi:hypothetical protein
MTRSNSKIYQANPNATPSDQPYQAVMIRQKVGVIVHSFALAYLSCHEQLSPILEQLSFALVATVSFEFVALSLTAGYLAFDHWYTALACPPKPLSCVSHDALCLSVLAVILAVTPDGTLPHYRTVITAWLVYQIIRQSSAPMIHSNSATSLTRTGTTSNMNSHATRIIDRLPPTKADLWYIHGQAYDLRPFINRHPGGNEALLLGQGRDDCTALVLSYHPFSLERVQATLAKYRVVGPPTKTKNNIKTVADKVASTVEDKQQSAITSTLDSDPFYIILCQRVEATLRLQNFDPLKNRAATWRRTAYYGFVTCSVLISGYFHLQVRRKGGGVCKHPFCVSQSQQESRDSHFPIFCFSLLPLHIIKPYTG